MQANAKDYQSRKCSLRAVLRDPASRERIQDAVRRCDTLWTHCLLFIKGFLLQKYEDDPGRLQPFPKVTRDFVMNAMRAVAGIQVNGGNEIAQQQRQDFHNFFVQHYAPTMPPEEPLTPHTNLTQVINYLSQELVTCYENNIKEHWVKHLNKFLNDALKKKQKLRTIDDGDGSPEEKKAAKTALLQQFDAVKRDLLNSRNDVPHVKQSPAQYHDWIDQAAFLIMPLGRTLQQNNVMYDIACSPQDYLYGMIFMGDFREIDAGLTNSKVKLLSVFPLKTSLVPRSIRIDSTSLLILLDWDNRTLLANREGELLERKNAAWDQFFNLNLRIFKGNQGACVCVCACACVCVRIARRRTVMNV